MKNAISLFINGLLALLPIIILVWILKVFYVFISDIISSIFSFTQNNLMETSLIIALIIAIILSIGYIVQKNKEALLIKIAEVVIGKIPVITSIYSTLKEVINLFSGKGTDNYLGVVYVKIGTHKVMGFVTKELEDSYFVFIPTTPNPTSGFLLIVNKDEVEKSDLSVANGFKKLVSLGIK